MQASGAGGNRVIYADTDFFVALRKESDPPQASAERFLKKQRGRVWVSPAVLTDLLLRSVRLKLDPEFLIARISQMPSAFLNDRVGVHRVDYGESAPRSAE